MNKKSIIKRIQERLPDDIQVIDQTSFEFTDDEFLSILSWIKYFNLHYSIHGKRELPGISFPIISSRLGLEFDLYRFKSDQVIDRGKYSIYLSDIREGFFKKSNSSITLEKIIITWKL